METTIVETVVISPVESNKQDSEKAKQSEKDQEPEPDTPLVKPTDETDIENKCRKTYEGLYEAPQQLLTCAESCIHALVRQIRFASRFWFTHVFLLGILIGYAALGAWLFTIVESPRENKAKADILLRRTQLQLDLWNLSLIIDNSSEWLNKSEPLLQTYELELKRLNAVGISTDPGKQLWSFWGAMFFCGTVFSTIGYGHIVPSTRAGQALTMVYATIGIPLLLMVLADFGKLLTRGIKCIWSCCHRFYHTGSCKKLRHTRPVRVVTRVIGQTSSNNVDQHKPNVEDSVVYFEVDDEFNLPTWVAILLLISYIMLGAAMFVRWEKNWSYFEAVYFIFISMSTIGFGDYVPDHPLFMMGTFLYFIFGLALTSMCINVIQESLTITFREASKKLSVRMGIERRETKLTHPIEGPASHGHENLKDE